MIERGHRPRFGEKPPLGRRLGAEVRREKLQRDVTLEPFVIGLAEFEVNPRDAAGKFVRSVTDAISGNLKGKISNDAPVNVSFVATAK